jgi:acyl-CoA reductase-like NAD-dependent aldehyde dehydrogenase
MTQTSTSMPVQHPDRFFIDGRWAKPSTTAGIDVIDCATEQLFLRVAEAREADVNRAVAAARAAFDRGPWPRMSHAERAVFLNAIARELEARAEDNATIWMSESGVVSSMARPASGALGQIYAYYAGLAKTFKFEEERQPGPGSGNVGLLVREPVGVVAAIIPWNGPAMASRTS